jgi:hypothetical protein
MRLPSLVSTLCAGMLATVGTARSDYLDDIGYRALAAELQSAGQTVPNGMGVTVSQVEASVGNTTNGTTTTYAYLPDSSLFPGVTITNQSGASYPAGVSWHANLVGGFLYGSDSMTPGITSVTAYLADDWIGRGLLKASAYSFSAQAPGTVTADVVNNSWVGTTAGSGSAGYDGTILSRLDYAIQRDDFVAVVGTNNGTQPQELVASAYNVISVGLSNGGHAAGTSTINTQVTFPHLVVPTDATSYATPIVSSAAALLIQTARGSSSTSANGDRSETIKAILMAGATKSQFANWSRTDTRPLDATYGAGQLNVLNSYHIMTAGEQTPNSVVAATGWDFNTLARNGAATYTFDLASDSDVSVALTWNAIYTTSDGNYNSLALNLANLDLSLYSVGDGGALTLVQQSISTDNVEYLWLSGLAAGKYQIKVTYGSNLTGTLTGVDYALAWQSLTSVPEPAWSGAGFIGMLVCAVFIRRAVS